MVVNSDYTPLSLDEIKNKLKNSVDKKRYDHSLRTADKAAHLAKIYGVNVDKAYISGLIHDYAKQRDDEEFIRLIKDHNLNADLLNYGNAVWHGIVGAEIIKDELNITNNEILDSVRKHTLADTKMSELDKIVFIADSIEDGRNYPGVKSLRIIADDNLDLAVATELQSTILKLSEQGRVIHPQTIVSYNYWVKEI